MGIRPPAIEDGEEGIRAFQEALKLSEGSLRSKVSREFYRRDLRRWHRLYGALATKREPGSAAARHFGRLSAVCSELLAAFGEEPPPRPRARKPQARRRSPILRFPNTSHTGFISSKARHCGASGRFNWRHTPTLSFNSGPERAACWCRSVLDLKAASFSSG